MREFIVENLTDSQTLDLAVIFLNNIIALCAAFFIMFTYRITYSGTAYSKKFNISLGGITLITVMIMSVISNNIALSLGMVGALSIIRFRTAVKDVRDATFIFWAIAVGIGCGVSQYALIAVGSVFVLLFFVLTKQVVYSNNQLLVIESLPNAQNKIEASIDEYFDKRAHQTIKNISNVSCELVYVIKEGDIEKAAEKNNIDIAQQLLKIEGVKRVNLVEQQDDISR